MVYRLEGEFSFSSSLSDWPLDIFKASWPISKISPTHKVPVNK
jgi:hypothetical protein